MIMRVEMLETTVGRAMPDAPKRVYWRGSQYDVDTRTANAWLASGIAKRAARPKTINITKEE